MPLSHFGKNAPNMLVPLYGRCISPNAFVRAKEIEREAFSGYIDSKEGRGKRAVYTRPFGRGWSPFIVASSRPRFTGG